MIETLNAEDFAAQLNTKFVLTESVNAFEIELVEVTEPKIMGSQSFFSLIFFGTNEAFLPQSGYLLSHEKLGEGLIFIVPIAKTEDGFQYESVFSRPVEAVQETGS